MPDSFTHVHIAAQALMRSGQIAASTPCFNAGANGPDPFYWFQLYKRRKHPDLPALGRRLHKEKAGDFLDALLHLSITPEQQSYTMGYLTHYSTDCTFNPYIAALGDKGLYTGRQGRVEFETAIESEMFYRLYRDRWVPWFISTPMLLSDDLAQVTSLLHDAILQVYDMDVPVVALSDAFHEYSALRKKLTTHNALSRFSTRLFTPLRAGKQAPEITGRMQPGKPLPPLPEEWKNPYSGEEMRLTFDEVTTLAESTGAALIVAAMGFWLGGITDEEIAEIVGDNNCYTGRPAKPAEEAAPPAQTKESENSNGDKHLA